MKKLLEIVLRLAREGIPLGKSILEFCALLFPLIKKKRGLCPLCHKPLWEAEPPDEAAEIVRKHLESSCSKTKASKENEAPK